jgi:thioredoxin 1
MSFLLLLAAAAVLNFTPLDQWKDAVLKSDRSALSALYASKPTLIFGKDQAIGLDNELQFWTGLRAAGVTEFHPKVLSIKEQGNSKQLVLRIQGATAKGEHFVSSAMQIWTQQQGAWRITTFQHSNLFLDQGRRLPEPAKPNPKLYPPPEEAQAELRSAYQQAAKQHKRILLVFGANWCYDCHVLDTTFHSKDFAPLLEANYIVVHINIGDEGKDNNDLAAKMGVALDKGVPNLAILDASGKVLVAQHGEFESTERIGPENVKAFLEHWKPTRS